MRCLICRRLSFSPLCRECRALFLRPEPRLRRLPEGLEVLSFFAYDEIEPLLLTKHHPHGWRVYRQMARASFAGLADEEGDLFVVPVDDRPSGGYSHTAILARALKRGGYRPLTGVLRSKNSVSYAGKPLAFRLANPRDFVYTGPAGIRVLLVDDVVTTGLTLQEAAATLRKSGVFVEGAIVLADVDRNGA